MANQLRRKLDRKTWRISQVDQYPQHYYQPGFLFMPFGVYTEKDVVKPKRQFVPDGVDYIPAEIDRIAAEDDKVILRGGEELKYDILIVATGTKTAPDETKGLLGDDWRTRIHEFYTFEGARALYWALQDWQGGRLVVHINEMPIKCPVAPLEFAFLADWWLTQQGLRDKTELVYVTPLSGAFTKPIAAKTLGHLLEKKNIQVVSDFAISEVDNENHKIRSWDEQEVDYDMLVTVPVNMGDAMVERSGLGDELNYIATDKHTLESKARQNIFVIGDATDLPTSKAGSVAHFESEVLTENILSYIRGEEMTERFDGHANCFIESGYQKAFLLDFNYEQEPVTGEFPFAGLGPLQLLGESRLNHLGKMAFRFAYWNVLLRALPIPFVSHRMTMAGKQIPGNA